MWTVAVFFREFDSLVPSTMNRLLFCVGKRLNRRLSSSFPRTHESRNTPCLITLVRWHGGGPGPETPTVPLTIVKSGGSERYPVEARVGETILQLAHRYQNDDWNLEGACEGVCACSTCHVILPVDMYDSLPEPSEDEEDMLDMAFGLTETSRLGCQVEITQDMAGVEVELPSATRNFYVDGHVPKPH